MADLMIGLLFFSHLTAYRVDASGYNGDYAASGSVILIKGSAVTLGPFSQVNYSNWLFGHSLQ